MMFCTHNILSFSSFCSKTFSREETVRSTGKDGELLKILKRRNNLTSWACNPCTFLIEPRREADMTTRMELLDLRIVAFFSVILRTDYGSCYLYLAQESVPCVNLYFCLVFSVPSEHSGWQCKHFQLETAKQAYLVAGSWLSLSISLLFHFPLASLLLQYYQRLSKLDRGGDLFKDTYINTRTRNWTLCICIRPSILTTELLHSNPTSIHLYSFSLIMFSLLTINPVFIDS